jgi:hypothetical protein
MTNNYHMYPAQERFFSEPRRDVLYVGGQPRVATALIDLRNVSGEPNPAPTAAADPTGGPNPLKALSEHRGNFLGVAFFRNDGG